MKLRTCTLIRRLVFSLAALALLLMLPQPAPAVHKFWVGDNGTWNNAGNWDPSGAPQNGDYANLYSTDSSDRTILYYNTYDPDAQLNGLLIEATGTGTMTLRQGYYAEGQSLSSWEEDVGVNGTGTHIQSTGTNTLSIGLILGFNAGSNGTYELQGGVLTAPEEVIGFYGHGTFTQSGGLNQGDGEIIVGSQHTSESFYNLNGGAINQKDEYIGNRGAGTFTQNAGVNSLSGALVVGNEDGSQGTYSQKGGATTVAGPLTIAKFAGSSGLYELIDGSLDAGAINVNSGGIFNQTGGTLLPTTFNQQGGVVQSGLENRGTFNYYSGLFGGRLWNYGAVNFAADFTASDGMANYSEFTIPTGRTITLNGSGLDNSGSIILAGGILKGNGLLVNRGTLSGYGTITGSGSFYNRAFFSQGSGNFSLSTTGYNPNFGNMHLAQGRLFTLGSDVTLTNRGTIDLNQATINGDGVLTNTYGGIITGPGTISSDFTNDAGGVLVVGGGTTFIPQPFTNNGLIQLTGFTANLTGGASTNDGTIQGWGNIGNFIANNGIIEALGGTLNLSGSSVSNNSGGLMTAGAGNKLLITQGLSGANVGVINLTGGTFDNNGHILNNTNQISGYGTIRASNITNSGAITLSGGTTTVNGNVANNATGHLNIAYNPAIFTGNVVNSGTVKVTDTTVTWAGTFTNSGSYISDPSDNYFTDLVHDSTGFLTGTAGDRWLVSNDFINQSTQNKLWNTVLSDLVFLAGEDTLHDFYLAGQDLGVNPAGYNQNFAWGTLDLTDQILSLFDGNTEKGGAQYVGAILGVLFHGLRVDNIYGNGFNIYYDASLKENAYLNGLTYDLMDGGQLMASTVPLPPSVLLFLSGLAGLGLLGRRKKQRNLKS